MPAFNVLYTVNREYIDIMLASLLSLIKNSNLENLYVHIISSGFLDSDYQKIEKFLDDYDIKRDYYPLEDFDINHYGIPNWQGSQIANARLFFAEILKNNLPLENLLYLDADTIIVDSLQDLNYYTTSICAVKDHAKKARLKKLNVNNYYNSGVLYINVDFWYKNKVQTKIVREIEKKPSLTFPDQDLLNLALGTYLTPLPQEYNLGPMAWLYQNNITKQICFNKIARQITADEINQALKRPKILHSYGFLNIKPWTDNTVNPYNDIFIDYLLKINQDFSKDEIEGLAVYFKDNLRLLKIAIIMKTYLPMNIDDKIKVFKKLLTN